ncbi:NADH-quinone oxidoreductase subunit L [Stomatohabitans albus]|uniref:NADH-quinone oxidoreductase subunit L n=1 Tax=Stomatohabitans albus TaxID=3110766 RepID=UPI00300DB39A
MNVIQPPPGSMAALIWLLPVLCVASSAVLVLGNRRLGVVGPLLGTATSLTTALMATVAFLQVQLAGEGAPALLAPVATWIVAGPFTVQWATLIDPLSAALLMLVTWVGLLVHVYSLGYMHHDENIVRFFGYLNLFIGSMAILVMGASLPVLFVGWELVGLCSFLLIGFWHDNPVYAAAAKKAFVINRIGDAAFLIAMFLLFQRVGTLDIPTLITAAPDVDPGVLYTACVLLFFGATAKSAQIPLFLWLPDAMAGPTPVSALIHAATMVTAGVYLIARLSIPFALSGVLPIVMWIGALTALMAAIVACFTNEYKQILAWSTISQLGYMMIGAGAGNHTASTFHLLTHGFFKAALFLAAGSVMHAMANSTDIRRMGGLAKQMPITAVVSGAGVLAIAGFPLTSGFFSKEEVLASAADLGGAGLAVWGIGIFTALLTAFYMTRWFVLIFMGEPRWEAGAHPHESPLSMTLPMLLLAVGSLVGGLLNATGWLEHWLAHTIAPYEGHAHVIDHTIQMGTAVAVGLLGIALGYMLNRNPVASKLTVAGGMYGDMARNAFWYDAAYERFTSDVAKPFAIFLSFVDRFFVDGLVEGSGTVTKAASDSVRNLQSGQVRTYAGGILVGVLVMAAIVGLTLLGA